MKPAILVFGMLLLLACHGTAQHRRGPEDRGPGRIERFKTMRLIEVLKLNEDEAARFTAKQREHEEKIRDLMADRNRLLDSLDDMLGGDGKEGALAGPTDAALSIDQKIFQERERYYGDLRKSLTPEQFARFLIFDRNFNRRVHDAIDQMRGQGGRKWFD